MTKKTNNTVNVNRVNNNNETKVVCPVCGTEFAIGEHEHSVRNGVAIGKDSGLGTVYLPVSKRGDQLRSAGIDPAKYFSIALPTGGEQMMKIDDNGRAVPVGDDDPVLAAIVGSRTVPNRDLFRRWVMSQMFHAMQHRQGVTQWIRDHGYDYMWRSLVEELRVQAKLYTRGDGENYNDRNRWINKTTVLAVAENYIDQAQDDARGRKEYHCKGVAYVKFAGQNIFKEDIYRKVAAPLYTLLSKVRSASTPKALYETTQRFYKATQSNAARHRYTQCQAWVDAYKGVGAYYTMQNLLRFHDCAFPKDNEFWKRGRSALASLAAAACRYSDEGWRMVGLLKQMIEENNIDIARKQAEWRAAKRG